MYYKRAQDLKTNKMPVIKFQFQQLCRILSMSVENIISLQPDLAAICKCSLILKKRLRRLIALSCLFLSCPAESQHTRERQLCKRPGLAVLVVRPAFGYDDTAESLVPSWTLTGLIITLLGMHWAGRVILWEFEVPIMQSSWSILQITAKCSIGTSNKHQVAFPWGQTVLGSYGLHHHTHADVEGAAAVCSAEITFACRYGGGGGELFQYFLTVCL